MQWTSSFLPISLALVLYRARLDPPLKIVWRFGDFAEFCMTYGMSPIGDKASALCVAFHQQKRVSLPLNSLGEKERNNNGLSKNIFQIGEQITTTGQPIAVVSNQPSSLSGRLADRGDMVSTRDMRRLIYLLSLSSASLDLCALPPPPPLRQRTSSTGSTADMWDDHSNANTPSKTPHNNLTSTNSSTQQVQQQEWLPNEDSEKAYECYVHPTVRKCLDQIEEDSVSLPSGPTLKSYVQLISDHESHLPGLSLLSMTACCLFGLRPSTASLEKAYITELMLWGQKVSLVLL